MALHLVTPSYTLYPGIDVHAFTTSTNNVKRYLPMVIITPRVDPQRRACKKCQRRTLPICDSTHVIRLMVIGQHSRYYSRIIKLK